MKLTKQEFINQYAENLKHNEEITLTDLESIRLCKVCPIYETCMKEMDKFCEDVMRDYIIDM